MKPSFLLTLDSDEAETRFCAAIQQAINDQEREFTERVNLQAGAKCRIL
jgi:hypothetical protein